MLEGLRDIGRAMKSEAEKVVPTLLKYADYNPYLADTSLAMCQLREELFAEGDPLETPAESLVCFPTERAADAHNRIVEAYPLEAQYVLPLAYRIRVLFTWNLRELFHFIQLRSAKQGHFPCRGIAQRVYGEIERVHPALAPYIRVDQSDYQLGRL